MEYAMAVLRPQDLPEVFEVLRGGGSDRLSPWRVRAFVALARVRDEGRRAWGDSVPSLREELRDWALVEASAPWSIQRMPLPEVIREALEEAGFRGSGRWEAGDRGGHWRLLAEAIAEAETARAAWSPSEEVSLLAGRVRLQRRALFRTRLGHPQAQEALLAWADEEEPRRKARREQGSEGCCLCPPGDDPAEARGWKEP